MRSRLSRIRRSVLALLVLCGGVAEVRAQLAELKAQVAANPKRTDLRVELARQQLKQKRYKDVIKTLKPPFDARERTPEVLYPLAIALTKMGKTGKAKKFVKRILKDEPSHKGAKALRRKLSGRKASRPGKPPKKPAKKPTRKPAKKPAMVARSAEPAKPTAPPKPAVKSTIPGDPKAAIPAEGTPPGAPDDLKEILDDLASGDWKKTRTAGGKLKKDKELAKKAAPFLIYQIAQSLSEAEPKKIPSRLEGPGGTASSLLRNLEDQLLETMTGALGDERLAVRRAALHAFSEINSGPKLDATLFTSGLGHEDRMIRYYSLKAANKHRMKLTEDQLLKLCTDEAPEIQASSLSSLAALKTPKAESTLVDFLTHEDEKTRLKAAEAAARNKLKACLAPMIKVLETEKVDQNRYWLATHLGDYRDKQAVPVLLEVVGREDDKASVATKGQAVKALGKIGEKAVVPKLIELLKNEKLRKTVIYALGELKDGAAFEPVLPYLEDEDKWVRDACTKALHKIAPKSPKDLEEDHAAWTAWWEKNKASVTGG